MAKRNLNSNLTKNLSLLHIPYSVCNCDKTLHIFSQSRCLFLPPNYCLSSSHTAAVNVVSAFSSPPLIRHAGDRGPIHVTHSACIRTSSIHDFLRHESKQWSVGWKPVEKVLYQHQPLLILNALASSLPPVPMYIHPSFKDFFFTCHTIMDTTVNESSEKICLSWLIIPLQLLIQGKDLMWKVSWWHLSKTVCFFPKEDK